MGSGSVLALVFRSGLELDLAQAKELEPLLDLLDLFQAKLKGSDSVQSTDLILGWLMVHLSVLLTLLIARPEFANFP